MPVPEWIARLHSRYSGAPGGAASSADKGDLMARSSFKTTKASPFAGKQAMPFGKKKEQGKSAPAQKALRSGSRPMSRGPR